LAILPHKFGRVAQRDGAFGSIPLSNSHCFNLGRVAQLGGLGAEAVGQSLGVELLVGIRFGQVLIERQSLRPFARLVKIIRPGCLIVLG